MDTKSKIAEAIESHRQEALELLQSLVRVPSLEGRPMGEAYDADALAPRVYWIVACGVGIEIAIMLLIAF